MASGPKTPSVAAPTATNTTAAKATPPTMANGMVRRGSLISEAMMAVRMNPSQLQKKIAAPARTPGTPFPSTGVKFSGFIAGTAKATNTASSTSSASSVPINRRALNSRPR